MKKNIPLLFILSLLLSVFIGQAYALHKPKTKLGKDTTVHITYTPSDSSFSVRWGKSKPLFQDKSTLIVDLGSYKQLKYLKIYDVIGKKVIFQPLHVNSGVIKISIASLKPGIYFCSVYSAKGLVETRKVIHL